MFKIIESITFWSQKLSNSFTLKIFYDIFTNEIIIDDIFDLEIFITITSKLPEDTISEVNNTLMQHIIIFSESFGNFIENYYNNLQSASKEIKSINSFTNELLIKCIDRVKNILDKIPVSPINRSLKAHIFSNIEVILRRISNYISKHMIKWYIPDISILKDFRINKLPDVSYFTDFDYIFSDVQLNDTRSY